MKIYPISLSLLLSLNACGPSVAEKVERAGREKAKNDSVALVARQELLAQQAEADHQKAVADSIVAVAEYERLMQQAKAENRELLRRQLIELKSQLEVERMKLNEVKQFRLLRTRYEKESQIAQQARVVEELSDQIREIQGQVSN